MWNVTLDFKGYRKKTYIKINSREHYYIRDFLDTLKNGCHISHFHIFVSLTRKAQKKRKMICVVQRTWNEFAENLEVSGKLRNFALVNWKRAPACSRHALLTACEVLRTLSFDGSNDRAPAFFEADTHYHLLARCKARCHSLLHAFNLIVINDKISHSTIALWFYYAKLTRTFHFSKCFSYNLPVFRIYCYLCTCHAPDTSND